VIYESAGSVPPSDAWLGNDGPEAEWSGGFPYEEATAAVGGFGPRATHSLLSFGAIIHQPNLRSAK
jgi:hypothetical protein